MKNYTILHCLFLILLSVTSIHSMQKNLKGTPCNAIQLAKQYNANHPFLAKELIEMIFLIPVGPEKTSTEISTNKVEKKAYHCIRKLVTLHETCQFLNQCVPFSKIIEFCEKKLNFTAKENALQKGLRNFYTYRAYPDINHSANCICSALIQAGAGKTTTYKDKPICFYAKSITIAQKCIANGHNIHQETLSGATILSHVLVKQYPANLLKFYIENKVKLPGSILYKLVHQLNDHCTSDALRHEFLEKCMAIFHVSSDGIKNCFYHFFKDTPLDRLCALPVKNDYLHESFKEIVIDIFIKNGCKATKKYRNFTTQPIKTNKELSLYEELASDKSIYKELLLDQTVIERSHKLLDETSEYDSIIEAVRTNNADQVSVLLINGHVSINERDKAGHTPLMLAVMQKNRKIVEMLLNYDADSDLESDIGRTALDIALENGDDAIATLIIDASDSKNKFI